MPTNTKITPPVPGQVSPQRLREIIDLIEAAKTPWEYQDAVNSLTVSEFEDYEAYKQNLPGHVIPTPKKIPAPKIPKVPEKTPEKKPKVPKETIIERIPYPKWWKELQVSPISLTGNASQTVVSPMAGYKIYIATIVISVDGETQILLDFGNFGTSGPIFLGGIDQPMAMVIAMGNSPAPCSEGGFAVGADGVGVNVGGFASWYLEED